MSWYPRVKCYPAYKQPVLHKFGKMREAANGEIALRCKCGDWVYAETSGPLYRAAEAHISAKAVR